MSTPPSTRRDDAATALKSYILSHDLSPGDPLPSEAVLLETLQVGRTSLREAMREMAAAGIIEARHGSGTYVGTLTLRAMHTELGFHARLGGQQQVRLHQIVDVREALELGLITSLAARGAQPDGAQLMTHLHQMDAEAHMGRISLDTDRRFHLALYEPLNNPVAVALLGALWDTTSELIELPEPDPRIAEAVADRHHAILLAVTARDPRGARVAMQNHFSTLREHLGMAAFAEDSTSSPATPPGPGESVRQ